MMNLFTSLDPGTLLPHRLSLVLMLLSLSSSCSVSLFVPNPATSPGTLNVISAASNTGTLGATGIDLMTYVIVTQPTQGTVMITNTTTGAYTYTANVGAIGTDFFTFKATNRLNQSSKVSTVIVTISDSLCVPTKQVFAYNGANQSWLFPSNCSSFPSTYVKMWGAGGGADWGPSTWIGGGAGYVGGVFPSVAGQTYTILVGGHGVVGTNNGSGSVNLGGFGGGGNGYATSGSGGGRSAVQLNGIELLTAGGGGGGGDSTFNRSGGPGGGNVGSAGISGCVWCGGGGTQSIGGSGGVANGIGIQGAPFVGGNGDGVWGAGGGSGYYGGGGSSYYSGDNGGGGGGSSFTGTYSGIVTLSGTGSIQGNSSDSDNGGAGEGGPIGSSGSSGLVVLYYGAAQIISIAPTTGTSAGGTTVSLTGLGFLSGTTVTVGGANCQNVLITSSNQLTCTTSATGSTGAADVVLSVPGSQSATLSSGFTYF